jgi:hypothetical protein
MTNQDAAWTPAWPACTTAGCIGIRIEADQCCLAHVDPHVRKAILGSLQPGADLDLRGTPIDTELLSQLLAAVRPERGRPTLGAVQFSRVQFTGVANFENAQFGLAQFDGAQFKQRSWFDNTRFELFASFQETAFIGETMFSEARFMSPALFSGAKFTEHVSFSLARFDGLAGFYDVHFMGTVNFGGAEFLEFSAFDGSHFERAGTLGPLLAQSYLGINRVMFEGAVFLEITGGKISLAHAHFKESAMLRLRYAALMLDRTVFAKPSDVIYAKAPFAARDPESSVYFSYFSETSARTVAVAARPRLLSLHGVDASTLTLTDLDLRACHFEGAHHLDQLRIEGSPPFSDPPRGWLLGRVGGQGLPVWRWTRRQTLAEEHSWRSNLPLPDSPSGRPHPKRAGWYPTTCRLPDWVAEQIGLRVRPYLGPEHLASMYRALRKTYEDNKNEPGAADFYYGEMEMRRLNRHTYWAERVILWLYWLVSGYGLRGLRALAWLMAVIVGLAGLLQAIGFDGGDPSFRDALTYSAQSTISITSGNKALSEHVSWAGEVIRIVLRLIGPVLLGLALLSIRNRVKR